MRAFNLLAIGVVGLGVLAVSHAYRRSESAEPQPVKPAQPQPTAARQAALDDLPRYVRDVYDEIAIHHTWRTTRQVRKVIDRPTHSVRQALWRLSRDGLIVGRRAESENHPLAKEWRVA
ncbi:hypothetical protein KIKIMORA_00270 [Brevundimonas phage vB_BpoS-Kikimora]|uniref:Uncharacterized protein n=1 Tax=Brevundimonas phage vB_BpoS-Kikimora TaxID=2948601 RepID=A0A9E7SL43_9CAUD|nr:hypothetical protein KIKIMORA_00270 [Brevundimonas phage vB_BpoS-Kikimora]